tara:strand:- start:1308 stop:2609 length:1302 start_codon:yes stop_codon:yes gene_type:complete
MPTKGEKGKGFQAEKWGTRDDLRNVGQELKDQLDTYDKIDQKVNKIFKVESLSLVAAEKAAGYNKKTNKEKVKSDKLDVQALNLAQDLVDNVKQRLAGFKKLQSASRLLNLIAKANPWLLVAGIIAGIVVAFTKFNKMVAETRKELGVSAAQAIILEGRFKLLALQGKLFGLETEDIKNSFNAIRENFGGIDQATNSFVMNLAKAQLFTGATASETARVIALQEAMSDLSRETLVSQAKITSALIKQAGVAPGAIFKDIADNAEFFAQYAKAGGQNLINAGIAARKLGLNMSHVAGISDSLLDFESSIEKQLEASMLLGRQINLDRARQLAITGDQEGMLKEVLKQVGGEAEFNRMNVIQRKALAESVGVNVEELSRLVRNRGAAAPSGTLNKGMSSQIEVLNAIHQQTTTTADNTGKGAEASKGFLSWVRGD